MVLINQSDTPFRINRGDRIAQFIFECIETPLVTETDTLPDNERGTKGFGSTGISGNPKVEGINMGSTDLGSEELMVIPDNIHGLSYLAKILLKLLQ